MKLIFLILLSLISLFIIAQPDTTIEKIDTLPQKYIGINVGSIISNITQGYSKSQNYSLKYRIEKHNSLIFQTSLNLKSEEDTEENYYCFTDTADNIHKRTYTENNGQFDVRVGIGIYEKLGYGNIYLVGDLLLGYTEINQTYNDFVNYVNNGTVEGFGGELIRGAKAGYFTAGIDFAIGYKINLGKHLSLGLEYVPEITFNTLIDTDYYYGDAEKFNFNKDAVNSYFNVFNVNLFYRF